ATGRATPPDLGTSPFSRSPLCSSPLPLVFIVVWRGICPRFAHAFYATRVPCSGPGASAGPPLTCGKLLNKQNPERHSYSECCTRQILLRDPTRPAAGEEDLLGPEEGARGDAVLGHEFGRGYLFPVLVLGLEHLDPPPL